MYLTAPFVTALPLEVGRFAKRPACGDLVVAGRASSRQATVSWLRRVAPLPWRLNFDHPYHIDDLLTEESSIFLSLHYEVF